MIGFRFVRTLAPSRECRMIGFFLGFDFAFLDKLGFFTVARLSESLEWESGGAWISSPPLGKPQGR